MSNGRIPAKGGNSEPESQKVLILENSRLFQQMVGEAVEQRLGLKVLQASSLQEARELLRYEGPLFLALTGLVLSDGNQDSIVDFFVTNAVPTVVVSGVYDEDTRQKILERPIIDYVLKNAPGAVEYLVWLVKRLDRNRKISALVVDDSISARMQTGALLELYGFKVTLVPGGQEGLDALAADSSIRLVIADHQMPGMDGIEFTRRVRASLARDRLAIVGVSGAGRSSLVAQFLKNGANDFLHKPFSREEFFCRISQNVDNLELIGSLHDLATKDYLTGLANRRHFFDRGELLFEQTRNANRRINVAMLDIDHFKRINDTFGHDAGDAALRAVAGAIATFGRAQDLIARFGGEEFCVLAPDLSETEAEYFFEGMRSRIEGLQIVYNEHRIPITTSIGVCVGRRPSLHTMLGEADRMLYTAKAGGRNRTELAKPEAAVRHG